MINTQEQVFKSKRGYHPCTYETFLKLKQIKKEYYKFLKDFHQYVRWNRKTVNQKGVAPAFDDKFLDKIYNKQHEWGWVKYYPATIKYPDGRCKLYPKKFTDHGILELLEKARHPQEEPCEHFDNDVLNKIDSLL